MNILNGQNCAKKNRKWCANPTKKYLSKSNAQEKTVRIESIKNIIKRFAMCLLKIVYYHCLYYQ